MNQKSLIVGSTVTVIWFLIIGVFCFKNDFGFTSKDLNSLGDFLAGIFAPIAFFWLILGYVQQGKQLDQNTKALEQQEKALNLQISEMKESVKQQTELAEIQKQQFRAMLNAAIGEIEIVNYKLRVESNHDLMNQEITYAYSFEFTLKAHVNELRNLKVLRYETSHAVINNIAVGESEDVRLLIFSELDEDLGKFVRKEVEKYEFSFTISYQTIYGEEKREDFFYNFFIRMVKLKL